MSADLRARLFGLGSVQRLVRVFADDLAQGRSLLVLLPPNVECDDVWEALGGELRQRECDARAVYADEIAPGQSILSSVADSLGVQWPASDTQRTVENLLGCDGLPEIIFCKGFDRDPSGRVPAWLELLSRWAEVAQNTNRPAALCLIVRASSVIDHVPATNVRLAVRWWWGVPSLLELRLLCREELGEDRSQEADNAWREHLLPALSGGDISLASDLWATVCAGEGEICEALTLHARARGWSGAALRAWGAHNVLGDSFARAGLGQRPAKPLERLWAEGVVHYTREHGAELQTAALYLLGQHEAVRHRIWRGQASLLLPIIDGVRLNLCRRLTEIYGRGWSLRWIPPAKEREYNALSESDYGCELGHLVHLLRACRDLRGHDGWIPLATQARDLRNELAHYRPISFVLFDEFWRALYAAEEGLVEAL
jgi:hypothetical protein